MCEIIKHLSCVGMQLVSASADGLIKLWTVRNGECENTFDSHKEKIWALATDPNPLSKQVIDASLMFYVILFIYILYTF